jgi:hypothetical protein
VKLLIPLIISAILDNIIAPTRGTDLTENDLQHPASPFHDEEADIAK